MLAVIPAPQLLESLLPLPLLVVFVVGIFFDLRGSVQPLSRCSAISRGRWSASRRPATNDFAALELRIGAPRYATGCFSFQTARPERLRFSETQASRNGPVTTWLTPLQGRGIVPLLVLTIEAAYSFPLSLLEYLKG